MLASLYHVPAHLCLYVRLGPRNPGKLIHGVEYVISIYHNDTLLYDKKCNTAIPCVNIIY